MISMKKASFYLILSALAFAIMNFGVRMMGDIPTFQKMFFRNLFPFIFSLIIILKNKNCYKYDNNQKFFIFLRALFGTLGVLANFYCIDNLKLADAAIFNKTSPFFIVLLSAIFLKEKIKSYQIIALISAFVGVYIISNPHSFNPIYIIALAGGFFAGSAYTALRHCVKNLLVKEEILIFCFGLFSAIVSLIPTLLNFKTMTITQLFFASIAGLGALVGQFSITKAYSLAPSNKISIFDYTNIIFNIIIGFFFFNEVLKINTIIGIIIIFLSSLYMFIKNNKKDIIKL